VPPIEKLGRRAWTVRADVACVDDVRAMVEGVLRQLGRLDLLVNNAAGASLALVRQTALDSVNRISVAWAGYAECNTLPETYWADLR
jgi:3-oxoacyl-[acyl-carrier protein] reductase